MLTLMITPRAPNGSRCVPLSLQEFGDVQELVEAYRESGLVVVTFFDLRAACSAAQRLHCQLLNGKQISINYCFPKVGGGEKGWEVVAERVSL